MFKSASFFRIADDFVLPPLGALEEALQATRFLPCGATQPESSGWVAPRGNKSTALVETINRQLIVRLCTERRPVPASAIKAAVEERIEKYKQETGRERVGAKIKKEFREEVLMDLMPRAFTKQSSTTLWINPVHKFLVVDSGSLTGADKVVSFLVEALSSVPGSASLKAQPVQTTLSAAASMSHWLSSQEAPVGFTVDRDCELKMPDDEKSTVRYSRHTLEIDEVAKHIAAGKVPTQLAMTWNDRVSFVLSEAGQIKKLKLLDVVLDGIGDKGKDDDGFDTDAAILTGELSALIPDLLEALGGELNNDATPKSHVSELAAAA
ncbi:recombination-associated protein RdgC [Polaromonas eurypsychrophila]|uniref:Recombination-associated protein RdgC n=1 Tax=Polaromonas eurypsychrophila TaxID=1614635 RepID=A0A916SHI4_9BURK|nr:recombination-associated protein RdgC [Polaromonas eurypsychrophila]GGB00911.1 recombination-associated protein RdgC [Polaromonas eurypsychrophila]